MEIKYIDRIEIERMEPFSSGGHGTLHKYGPDYVAKLLYLQGKSMAKTPEFAERVKMVESNKWNELSLFLKSVFMLQDKVSLYGHVLPHILGFNFKNPPPMDDIDMEKFDKAIQKATPDLIDISRRGIRLIDLYADNVIYDTKRGRIVLIDYYESIWQSQKPRSLIQKENFKSFNGAYLLNLALMNPCLYDRLCTENKDLVESMWDGAECPIRASKTVLTYIKKGL